MENKTPALKKATCSLMPVRSGLKVGYRPVHGLVAPDGATRWIPGWFDLDSQGRYGAAESAPPPPAD